MVNIHMGKHTFTWQSLKASALFSTPPQQWGLRGDPFLWREMKEYFRSTPLEEIHGRLPDQLEQAFCQLTGYSVGDEESVFVERFSHGGMSSGHVHSTFWRTTVPNLLKSRLAQLNRLQDGESLPTIKIMTWNCHEMDFEQYMPFCKELSADIMVIAESRQPAKNASNCLWVGAGKRGLAVVARNGYEISGYGLGDDLPSYYQMVSVERQSFRFNLMGVWTQNASPRYIQGAHQVLDYIKDPFMGPYDSDMIVVGDFNSNTTWDKLNGKRNHSSFVKRLRDDHMMASAYHHFNGEQHGFEQTPTYFHQYKLNQPFHIDYCFAPLEWCDRIVSVFVGSPDEWLKRSDHMPLVVEYALLPW